MSGFHDLQIDDALIARAGLALPVDELEAHVQWLDHRLSQFAADPANARPAEASAERLWRERNEALDALLVLRNPEFPSLRAGDVLTAIDGRALQRTAERSAERQLVDYIRTLQPGGTVKVDYQRAGKATTASVQTMAAEPAIARLLARSIDCRCRKAWNCRTSSASCTSCPE